MSASSPVRLAVAVAALGVMGFAPAAQAATVLANVAGTVVGAVVANALIKGKNRSPSANCRLYDRDGRQVYLPCDANRPLGEVVYADGAASDYGPAAYAPQTAYPVPQDCDCLSAYNAGYSQQYSYDSAYGYQGGYAYAGWSDQASYGYPYGGAQGSAGVAGRDAFGYLTWAGKHGR